jgi:hypothetical protein
MSTYSIVAIGAPGSGKTVYLAVLYNLITSGQLARGVRVKTDVQTGSWLSGLYRQVADPNADFPAGTHPGEHLRETELVISVERTVKPWFSSATRLLSFEILRVSYIDYAGEWVTEAYRQDSDLVSGFQTRVDAADVVLCFLDGQRLVSMLEDPARDPEFLNGQLRPTIRMASNLGKPVAIVLSKWDTVAADYTLEELLKSLDDDGLAQILDLAQTRSARRLVTRRPMGGVFVIPVSSTGAAFVRTSPDGTSVKSGSERFEPINVMVPFAVGLVEIARMGVVDLKARASNRRGSADGLSESMKQGADALNDGSVPLGVAGISIDIRKTLAFAGDVSIAGLRLLSGPARATGRRMRRECRRITSLGLAGVRSEEGALLYFSRAVHERLEEYSEDTMYRGSRIWSDGDDWRLDG